MVRRRRALLGLLTILALFLCGTIVVLSSITYYLSIDPSAYLTEFEVPYTDPSLRWNASEHGQVERIPRILHQTWKTGSLPEAYKGISQACRDMMPDYEYMLWTDESSREFIARHYPWFLNTFDDYSYAILRADAIRYFVLYHYGGVYLDMDIGCLRPLDPLLVYPVILPKTIPVGVSNDLMFAQKHHPFFAQTIHNLATFDHSWILHYPTVMFSTGPMFLSIQHGIFTAQRVAGGAVRILPKSLYGKNADAAEAPHSFFSHYYGSSWHSDDAAFIWFLGEWGKGLMWVGLVVLIIGTAKIWPGKQRRRNLRRIGGYDVLFPRRSGRWQLHVGEPTSGTSTQLPSPDDSEPSFDDLSVLHLPFDVRPSSPTSSDGNSDLYGQNDGGSLFDVVRRVRNRFVTMAGGKPLTASPPSPFPRTPVRRRHRHNNGVLFFLPAMFTQPPDLELGASFSRAPERDVPLAPRPFGRREKQQYDVDASPVELLTEGVHATLRSSVPRR
ncbi:Glycosyltransferase family 32 protein [Mycena chlorophos]|uniref:Glycosyltransferase family 32 protein n=1 Tax=Mycena chlorophos TaxID=658473 RepID=A0A8H6VUH7_MYCCL|nr:Glycosyltransferase family 32 protein [Mycena chlorophos]